MKNYSQEESDQESSTRAQLIIYVDADGKIAFGCDWEENDGGIDAVVDMFFQLKHKDLLEQILAVLYKQCVIEDRVEMFNDILKGIHSRVLDDTPPESLIVRPTAQGDRYV